MNRKITSSTLGIVSLILMFYMGCFVCIASEMEQITVEESKPIVQDVVIFEAVPHGKIVMSEASRGTRDSIELVSTELESMGYTCDKIEIVGQNRRDLEGLIMGEAGGEGFVGAALVAQAIRDSMVFCGEMNTRKIKDKFGYSASLSNTPNKDTKDAVRFIFDNGNYAVNHRVIYFYSPNGMKKGSSKFHESQLFVVEYKNHRFFDRM